MNPREFARQALAEYKDEIVRVAQDLIRIPSRNSPPDGEELKAQQYIAGYLEKAGLQADMYDIDTVPGMLEHEYFHPGRNYKDRPNVSSLLSGSGGGRSLLITGHVDTVVLGDNVWQHDPFGAEVEGNRLYGLGSIDMKGPLAAMLVMFKALKEKGIALKGDLRFESVVDEEEGGVNATIAGRLREGPMDASIIVEGTELKIYPAARGQLISDFIFGSTKGTWLDVGRITGPVADVVQQVGYFLTHIPALEEARTRAVPVHPLYASYPSHVPLQVTKVYAGGWGYRVPIAVPEEGRIELIMNAMPGETREEVQAQLGAWLDSLVERHPDVFPTRPEQRFRLRWMLPTAMDPEHELVRELEQVAGEVLGSPPPVLGAPYACDMFALQQIFDMPSVLFGPTGGQAHSNDEFIELDTLFQFFEAITAFVLRWCG